MPGLDSSFLFDSVSPSGSRGLELTMEPRMDSNSLPQPPEFWDYMHKMQKEFQTLHPSVNHQKSALTGGFASKSFVGEEQFSELRHILFTQEYTPVPFPNTGS